MTEEMYIDKIDMTEPGESSSVVYQIRDTTSGYITKDVNNLTHYETASVAGNKYQTKLVAADHIVINPENNNISAIWSDATTELSGLMSAEDKTKLNNAVTKLNGIEANAEKNVVNGVTVNGDSVINAETRVAEIVIPTIPTKVSDLTNDSGYIGNVYITNDPSTPGIGQKQDGIVTLVTNRAYNKSSNPLATMSDINAATPEDGVLTLKLNNDSIGTFSANSSTDVSINIDLSAYVTNTVLTTVLEDYPTSSSLSSVATTGNYTDLSNRPDIPIVNNAQLTIQKNGVDITTFTANSSTNAIANIIVPVATNDLTNNSGFITNGDIVPYLMSSIISGYNPNTTQTLKNINGTLTWVTDTI